jgi:hypothetical protein
VAFVLNDRVKETTTTTGTGTVNLGGAATGFETFVAGVGNSNSTYYCIAGQTTAEFEVGIGTVTDASPDTLSRTTILSSSNSDNAVDFSAGTKDVFCTLPAAKTIREFDTAVNIPTGTTAQRSSSAAAGDFRYNTTTGRFEGYSSAWNALGGSNTFSTDIFAGDGSDTTFTLSQSIENENDLFVFIDGVFQAHNSYSVSGTTLTFSTAPANGRVITAYSVKSAVSGNNVTISTMDGDGSDTTLTLAADPVNENNVQVYIDGVYQNKDTFAVSGTTLTFSAAPPNGTKVEAITLTQTNINTATQLADADGDTKVQVEESSDEDTIRMDIAGTEVLTLTNSAMTLKGTTPTLTIGDAGAEDTKIVFDGNAQDYYIGLDDSADDLIIGKGSTVGTTPAVVIDENLNVGIGGTPSSLLHLGGATNKGIEITSSTSNAGYLSVYQDQAIFGINRDGSDGSFADTGKAAAVVKLTSADADSSISFQTTTSNNAEPNVRATIDKDGNFGIGTASPFSKTQITETGWSSGAPYGTVLTVTGNDTNDANWGHLLITDSSTGTGNGGMLRFATGSTSSDISPFAGLDGFTEGSNYGGLKFLTRANGGTATERMRIISTGQIGVGTTAPVSNGGTGAGLIHIEGGSSDWAILHCTTNTTGSASANGSVIGVISDDIYIYSYASAGVIKFGTANAVVAEIAANGTFFTNNGTVSSLSDKRIKTNIQPISEGLDIIKKLNPVTYEYCNTYTDEFDGIGVDDGRTHKGFIADEVQEIAPSYVEETTGVVLGEEVDDLKTLSMTAMIPMLVKSIQEQQTLIETLQAKVEALENG